MGEVDQARHGDPQRESGSSPGLAMPRALLSFQHIETTCIRPSLMAPAPALARELGLLP